MQALRFVLRNIKDGATSRSTVRLNGSSILDRPPSRLSMTKAAVHSDLSFSTRALVLTIALDIEASGHRNSPYATPQSIPAGSSNASKPLCILANTLHAQLDQDTVLPKAVEQIASLRQFLLTVAAFVFAALTGCENADEQRNSKVPYGLVSSGSNVHHFGEHPEGMILRHVFVLTNNTERTVKIIDLSTSCKCVVAGDDELGSLTIPPHETFSIPVSMTTSGAQTEASGRVIVRYCDALGEKNSCRGQCSLLVKATVVPAYRISPPDLDFGMIDGLKTQTVTKTVHITPVDFVDLQVKNVRAMTPFIVPRIVSSIPGASDILLDVTMDVSQFAGSRDFEGLVALETNCRRSPHATIRVHGRFTAAVEAEPNVVIISSSVQGGVERQVRLVTTRPSRILSVALPQENLIRVRWTDKIIKTHHTMTLEIPESAQTAIHVEIPVEIEFMPDSDVGTGIHRQVTIHVSRFRFKENANG